jgi:hypothetical protein
LSITFFATATCTFDIVFARLRFDKLLAKSIGASIDHLYRISSPLRVLGYLHG